MSILIDVVLVLVFGLFVFKFTKDGFIMTLVKIGGKWLSVFVSLVLSPIVTGRLHEWVLLRHITSGIKSTLVGILESNPNGYNLEDLFTHLPNGFRGLLDYFGVSLASIEAEYGSASAATDAMLGEIALKIATPCSETIASILSYIICFVFSALFFWWLRRNVQRIMRHSFFRYVDIASGFLIGTVLGICVVFLLVTVTFTVFQLFIVYDASSTVMDIYNKSYVFRFLKSINMMQIVRGLL